MTDTLSIAIHNKRLSLESDNADFMIYARTVLASMLAPSVRTPDIRVHLHWGRELIPAGMSSGSYSRLGRRLLMDGERIVQTAVLLVPGLQVATSISGAEVVVEGAFRPLSWRMKLDLALGGRATQTRFFAALVYYLVYFPLLEHIERTCEWYPLHASGVAWPQGAVMLAGLGGVGKSTITMAFLADPDVRVLSENLILHDEESIYAFPEPIHLDKRSREMLAGLHGRLESTGKAFTHGRESYEVTMSARVESATPRLFCALRRGQGLSLRPMSRDEALEFALSSDVLARELNEYAQQAAVLNLLSPRIGARRRRIETLEQLLSGVACYELVVGSGKNLNQVVDMVREKLG